MLGVDKYYFVLLVTAFSGVQSLELRETNTLQGVKLCTSLRLPG